MKVIKIEESREICNEAGWYARDIHFNEPMDEIFIQNLKALGSFLYLPMLKQPFFKIENDHYLLKGIKGDTFLRMAVHMDYEECTETILDFIQKES